MNTLEQDKVIRQLKGLLKGKVERRMNKSTISDEMIKEINRGVEKGKERQRWEIELAQLQNRINELKKISNNF